MSEQIAWCVELLIQPGQLDSFLELTAEMVEETAKEPGVLTYQRAIGMRPTKAERVCMDSPPEGRRYGG